MDIDAAAYAFDTVEKAALMRLVPLLKLLILLLGVWNPGDTTGVEGIANRDVKRRKMLENRDLI